MTALDAATKQLLQNALYAYVQNYGGETIAEVRAIAGSIFAVQEKVGALVSKGLEIEQWVDELVKDFDRNQLAERVWNEGERAIATQAKNWRENLEVKTRATLDAYIQKYAPDLTTVKIQNLVATILPVVEDVRISRDEAQQVINKISEEFDWQSAIARVIDSQWLFLAEKAMQIFRRQDLEASVTDVMTAYVHSFQPAAAEIGESLVEQAIEAVTNSRVVLDLETALDAETRKLMVKQVMLKFNLLTAAPPPSRTALEVAQQVHNEVVRFRREQGLATTHLMPEVNRTDDASGSSQLGGEMSIGFELQPRRSQRANRDTEPEEG